MNNKIYLFSAILFFTAVFASFATQITKVGVIDRARILQTFYKESTATRELDEMQEAIQTEILRLNDEVKLYEERKLKAEDRGDESEALRLDNIIFEKKQYMQDYYRTKTNQLTERKNNLTQDIEFARELVEVIDFIAQSQGMSIVIDKTTPGIWYYNPEVDITDMVLEHLQSRN